MVTVVFGSWACGNEENKGLSSLHRHRGISPRVGQSYEYQIYKFVILFQHNTK